MDKAPHADGMFLVSCNHCSHRELRGYRGIVAVGHGSGSTELIFSCTRCRHAAVVRTGGGTAPAAPPVVPAA